MWNLGANVDDEDNYNTEKNEEEIDNLPTKPQTRIYNIDSSLRIPTQPTHNFTYVFNPPLRYVSKIALHSLELPNTFYNVIGASYYDNLRTKYIIPDGNYTIEELVDFINNQGIINLTLNTKTLKITATGNFSWTLDDFTELSLGYKLGFRTKDISGSLIAPSTYLINDKPYIFLKLNDITVFDRPQAFAKIQINVPKGQYLLLENDILKEKNYLFPVPIGLHLLNISIIDKFGNLVDLNGHDLSMSLEITTDVSDDA